MLINLFTVLFPKVLYSTLIVVSTYFYTRKQTAITLSALSGLVMGMLVHTLDNNNKTIQCIFSFLSVLLITSLGFKIMMMKRCLLQHDLSVKRDDVLMASCLPFIYITNQSLGIPQHIIQKSDFMTQIQVSLILLFSCSVIGLTYYVALLCCYSQKIQKLSLTSLLYFMGALDMSTLFGTFERPVSMVTNIIQLVRKSHLQYSLTRRLINAFVGTNDVTNWNGTGYSIYWIMIAISIVYIHKK